MTDRTPARGRPGAPGRIATQATALARSRSRTPLPQASCAPPPFERVLRGSRGADAWTNGHWIRRRVQAFAVAEAAGRPRQEPEAHSEPATGCANALARHGISLRAPLAPRRSLRVRAP